jgi:hypothetical protein
VVWLATLFIVKVSVFQSHFNSQKNSQNKILTRIPQDSTYICLHFEIENENSPQKQEPLEALVLNLILISALKTAIEDDNELPSGLTTDTVSAGTLIAAPANSP